MRKLLPALRPASRPTPHPAPHPAPLSPRSPLPLLAGVGCNEKCTCRNCENPCGAVKRETKVKLNPNERKAAKAAAAIAAAAEQAAIPGRRPAELDGGGTVGDMALRPSGSFGDMAPAPPPADPPRLCAVDAAAAAAERPADAAADGAERRLARRLDAADGAARQAARRAARAAVSARYYWYLEVGINRNYLRITGAPTKTPPLEDHHFLSQGIVGADAEPLGDLHECT